MYKDRSRLEEKGNTLRHPDGTPAPPPARDNKTQPIQPMPQRRRPKTQSGNESQSEDHAAQWPAFCPIARRVSLSSRRHQFHRLIHFAGGLKRERTQLFHISTQPPGSRKRSSVQDSNTVT